MDLFKQLPLIKPVKEDNITKKYFSSQCEPHRAKLCFSVVFKNFLEIHRELLFLVRKVTISEKNTEIFRKFVFYYMFEKGQILRKIWICLNNYF